MKVHDHRKIAREDLPDFTDQHAIEFVAPRISPLQKRAGIDREADEIESDPTQLAQFAGKRGVRIRERRKHETLRGPAFKGCPGHHMADAHPVPKSAFDGVLRLRHPGMKPGGNERGEEQNEIPSESRLGWHDV
ncbi:MAG TPA: hypothetical protein VMR29_00480 [Candidatus Binatia bacterium]|nr:hypothetical protein [Candidatus Binatia bacterium]